MSRDEAETLLFRTVPFSEKLRRSVALARMVPLTIDLALSRESIKRVLRDRKIKRVKETIGR